MQFIALYLSFDIVSAETRTVYLTQIKSNTPYTVSYNAVM
jgi:hypothetical protein